MKCQPVNMIYPLTFKNRKKMDEPNPEKVQFQGGIQMPRGGGILFKGHAPVECYANYMPVRVSTANPDFPIFLN